MLVLSCLVLPFLRKNCSSAAFVVGSLCPRQGRPLWLPCSLHVYSCSGHQTWFGCYTVLLGTDLSMALVDVVPCLRILFSGLRPASGHVERQLTAWALGGLPQLRDCAVCCGSRLCMVAQPLCRVDCWPAARPHISPWLPYICQCLPLCCTAPELLLDLSIAFSTVYHVWCHHGQC